MPDRKANFERAIADYDEKALTKEVRFEEHRFVSIERDKLTGMQYAKGHKTMRGACGFLSRAVEGAEAYIPEHVLDLDSGELHELDVFGFVAPRSAEAVAVMLPRNMAETVAGCLKSWPQLDEVDQAVKLIEKSLARRR